MKKIGLIILLIFSFLLLTNCNKGKNEEVKNENINDMLGDKNEEIYNRGE